MSDCLISPPGARIIGNFVSEQEANRLLAETDASDWRVDLKRRVQHYGWRYDYRERRVTADMRLGPLPDWLGPVAEAVGGLAEFDRRPDQVIVNEYLPGQGISAHVDCEPCFGPAIASLSLGGRAEMVFRHRKSGERRALILEPLMLLILAREARYDWTHEIPPRQSDVVNGAREHRARRVSLTFRTVTL
ncbi:alpha-ketoglutarate-dependent dioxygenase AlkB [Hyphobacterium sp. SN044]|uniref:alpha-ketoglutarate-dependent dioxygenase AlkB n=1 Tax=Hyphobacterium sp. SN044 TaxID=2912575 RepID=UPI001F45F493|nr:alpha-ketoglutarate-dependent dioxygenase AlkB [Hyphobacterium sp. SN044]MCF8878328.1 alpha-ketoglutarate-dependent dioxygenase AlkB [Hyphobacterium sp. SN044]